MEMTLVNNETYSDVKMYLDVISDYIKHVQDLSRCVKNGCEYYLAHDGEYVCIVENERGELNPYYVGFNELGNVASYSTEEFNVSLEFDDSGICKVERNGLNFLNPTQETLLLGRENGLFLSYINYLDSIKAASAVTYDITSHQMNLSMALNSIEYHKPIGFSFYYKNLFNILLSKSYKLIDDRYYRIMFNFCDNNYINPFIAYDPDILLSEFGTQTGLNVIVPDDLKAYLSGSNSEYNKLNDLCLQYQKLLGKM